MGSRRHVSVALASGVRATPRRPIHPSHRYRRCRHPTRHRCPCPLRHPCHQRTRHSMAGLAAATLASAVAHGRPHATRRPGAPNAVPPVRMPPRAAHSNPFGKTRATAVGTRDGAWASVAACIVKGRQCPARRPPLPPPRPRPRLPLVRGRGFLAMPRATGTAVSPAAAGLGACLPSYLPPAHATPSAARCPPLDQAPSRLSVPASRAAQRTRA